MTKFNTVLVANRGEIALRIMRALREMGLKSVALYSDADAQSRHRFYADHAVRLPGTSSQETYLAIPKIIEAVQVSGAQAVHPGYGFLSENQAFCQAVVDAGFVFIGPTPHAMAILGDKIQAKALMRSHNVPVTPGSQGGLEQLSDLKQLVSELGFPLILKAAAGGGGRGMRVVRTDEELPAAFEACQRQAWEYFGNRQIFAERFIENPRHIEVQVLCDSHGLGVHLCERDCSVQRRHQKLIEEAPSCYLNPEQRRQLGATAVKAALAAGYTGAGTVEFICESPEKIYFMEMNTRIQVEHTVSEEICRVDLVAEQIKVAQGAALSFDQQQIHPIGWAMECRINAEDPQNGFAPSPTRITKLRLPAGPFVRVDTHIYEGYEIPPYYDSMIAKIVAWGQDRLTAIARMKRALSETIIEGPTTTIGFHEGVLNHPAFVSGDINTGFLQNFGDEILNHLNGVKPSQPGDPSEQQDPAAELLALVALQSSSRNSQPVSLLDQTKTSTWGNRPL